MNYFVACFFFFLNYVFSIPVFSGAGLPEVLNVLADSYADPVHKDYGGENFVFFGFRLELFSVLVAANVDIFCNLCFYCFEAS